MQSLGVVVHGNDLADLQRIGLGSYCFDVWVNDFESRSEAFVEAGLSRYDDFRTHGKLFAKIFFIELEPFCPNDSGAVLEDDFEDFFSPTDAEASGIDDFPDKCHLFAVDQLGYFFDLATIFITMREKVEAVLNRADIEFFEQERSLGAYSLYVLDGIL